MNRVFDMEINSRENLILEFSYYVIQILLWSTLLQTFIIFFIGCFMGIFLKSCKLYFFVRKSLRFGYIPFLSSCELWSYGDTLSAGNYSLSLTLAFVHSLNIWCFFVLGSILSNLLIVNI